MCSAEVEAAAETDDRGEEKRMKQMKERENQEAWGRSRSMQRHVGVEVEGEMSFRGPGMLNILPCDPCIMDLV